MMRSAIEMLWCGELSLCESCGADDPEIETLVTLMMESKETIAQELSKEQLAQFTQYVKWTEKYMQYMSSAAFRDGFSVASKLLTEALLK